MRLDCARSYSLYIECLLFFVGRAVRAATIWHRTSLWSSQSAEYTAAKRCRPSLKLGAAHAGRSSLRCDVLQIPYTASNKNT
jgi:hypothetical protein